MPATSVEIPTFSGVDVSVVRRHHFAAGDIPIPADQQSDRQQGEQAEAHAAAAVGLPHFFSGMGSARHRAGGRRRHRGASLDARHFAPFRGTDLRARSAIALLSSRAGCGLVLDRVAQIFLDDGKLGDHALDGLAINAGKRGVHQFLAEIAKALQQRPGLGG